MKKTCHNACDFPDCTLEGCGMKRKLKHGGKRDGAGRKNYYGEKTKTISFRVPISMAERINKYVDKLKLEAICLQTLKESVAKSKK